MLLIISGRSHSSKLSQESSRLYVNLHGICCEWMTDSEERPHPIKCVYTKHAVLVRTIPLHSLQLVTRVPTCLLLCVLSPVTMMSVRGCYLLVNSFIPWVSLSNTGLWNETWKWNTKLCLLSCESKWLIWSHEQRNKVGYNFQRKNSYNTASAKHYTISVSSIKQEADN